jgi:hypothetical protein
MKIDKITSLSKLVDLLNLENNSSEASEVENPTALPRIVGHVPKNADQHMASAPPEFNSGSQQNLHFQNPYVSGYLPNQPISMPMPDFSSLSSPGADLPPAYDDILK